MEWNGNRPHHHHHHHHFRARTDQTCAARTTLDGRRGRTVRAISRTWNPTMVLGPRDPCRYTIIINNHTLNASTPSSSKITHAMHHHHHNFRDRTFLNRPGQHRSMVTMVQNGKSTLRPTHTPRNAPSSKIGRQKMCRKPFQSVECKRFTHLWHQPE
jgi:hypothetical protein